MEASHLSDAPPDAPVAATATTGAAWRSLCKWAGRIVPLLCLAAILVPYGIIQSRYIVRAFGETDPNGYLLTARAIATGQPVTFSADDPFRFQDHTWVENHRGALVSKFSPGYPLVLGLVRRVFGDDAMFVVNPVLGGLTLIGLYLLFRLWMSALAALLATGTFSASLLFLFYAAFPLTHTLDVCVTTWGMYALWKWSRTPSRGSAIGAGLLCGFAVAVRHVNVLLVLPVLAAVAGHAWQSWRGRTRLHRSALILGAAYALPLLLLAAYQWRHFGSPLTSGYSLAGEQGSIHWNYFTNRFPRYIGAMHGYLGWPFLFGAFALLLTGGVKDRCMRLLWVLPPLVLYSCYYWEQHWFQWNLRFILPTLAVYYGAAFAWLDQDRLRGFNVVALVAFCFLSIRFGGVVMHISPARALLDPTVTRESAETRTFLRTVLETLPPDAGILADSPAAFYLAARRQYTVYDLRAFDRAASQAHFRPPRRPDEAARMQPARTAYFQEFYADHSQAELTRMQREVVDALLADATRVFAIVAPDRAEREQATLGPAYTWTRLDIDPPSKPLGVYEVVRASAGLEGIDVQAATRQHRSTSPDYGETWMIPHAAP